jgi:hypothetical protein
VPPFSGVNASIAPITLMLMARLGRGDNLDPHREFSC